LLIDPLIGLIIGSLLLEMGGKNSTIVCPFFPKQQTQTCCLDYTR